MPPNNDNPLESVLPQEVENTGTESEAAFSHDVAPTIETFEHDPQSAGATAIAEISAEADAVTAEAESALAEIPASLGSTEEEVGQVESETGLMAKLRGIGEQVAGVASDARVKIGELVSHISGKMGDAVGALATGAIIGLGASTPNVEKLEAPLVPEVTAQARGPESETERKNRENLERQEKRDAWHEAHGVQKSLNTLRSYHAEHSFGKKAHTSSEEAEKALNNIDAMIESYPEELRKDILDDDQFTDALTGLNSLRGININADKPGQGGEIAKNIGKAIEISHRAIERMHSDMIHSAEEKLRGGDAHGLAQMADLYDEHIENTAMLSEGNDDPGYARSVVGIADETLSKFSHLLEEDSRGKDPSLTRGKTRLLEFLARAGEPKGVELLTQKIKSGEISVEELGSVFNDIEMGQVGVSSLNIVDVSDPRHARIGKGGEALASSLLSAYGLAPEEYLKYWKSPDAPKYFNPAEFNTKALVHLEERMPGGMKRLTESAGIRHPGRYPIELLEKQLKTKKGANLKYGGTISGLDDGNGAFVGPKRIEDLYEQARAQGLELRVAEAGSRLEVAKRLDEMVLQNGGKMSFLGIRGHGSPKGTTMAAGPDGLIDADFLGVPSDPENPDRSSLLLLDGAPIYFESCSTGAEDGIAQDLSEITPSPRRVTGPDIPTSIEELALVKGADGKFSFNIKYAAGQAKTYYRGKEVESSLPPKAFDLRYQGKRDK